jgi:hypothetical protein
MAILTDEFRSLDQRASCEHGRKPVLNWTD